MSRAKETAAADIVPPEVLKRVYEELRRHGIRARIRTDLRGVPDLYIDYDHISLLDKLCEKGVLSEEAREILC